jgi:cell division protein ZipA
MEQTYLAIGAAAALVFVLTSWFVIQRNRKQDRVDMPQHEGDPLFDVSEQGTAATSTNTGRWGDQIVGKPRVISAESVEERISRIHQRAQEYQKQHARPNLYATPVPSQGYSHATSMRTTLNHHLAATSKTAQPKLRVLYVMAPTGVAFTGYELHQSLVNTGLIYGKMNIFHYHLHEDAKQPILFSVASAVNPGVIDIDNIGSFSTPGLTLFINTPHRAHQQAAYEAMITVAEQLAEELGGIILDEQRQPWSMPEAASSH